MVEILKLIMKKFLGLIVIFFYSNYAYGLTNILQDYNQIIDCKLTKLRISFENKIDDYDPDQVPEDIKRISVEIKARKKNNELFITGLSRFLNYDGIIASEEQYETKVIEEDTILLGVFDREKTHKQTVVIDRMTGKLIHSTHHSPNLKDGRVEKLYYNCQKAVQKF